MLVWNELKGFYDDAENRWDYEGYTALYNEVYKAVKAVRPDVQVGGPYAVITSLDPGQADGSGELKGDWGVADQRSLDVVDYWLKNNVGADFIALDGATATRQKTAPADDRPGVGEVRRHRGVGAPAHAAPDLVGRVLRRGARGRRGGPVRARQRRRRTSARSRPWPAAARQAP